MLDIVFIVIGIIFNTVCLWSIKILLKEKKELLWKHFLISMVGLPVGFAVSLLLLPISLSTGVLFAVMGGALGELLFLFYVTIKQSFQKETIISYYDDGTPAKFFITGDKHRHFDQVKEFCHKMNTRPKDVLIILGDAGFNYYDDKRDDELKKEISSLNITLFCVHGNKEKRPQNVGTYGIRSFCGGKVYYEPKYPNIYFAIDGQIYIFEGKKYMVVGGAHSVDKVRCLEDGTPFWYDEMPDNTVKKTVEERLQKENNQIYGMLTHTCPIDYLPTEMFMSTRQTADLKRRKISKKKAKKAFRPDVDRSTEQWLGDLEKKLNYKIWFCGHYHIDKEIDKIQMMYREIRPLHLFSPCNNE